MWSTTCTYKNNIEKQIPNYDTLRYSIKTIRKQRTNNTYVFVGYSKYTDCEPLRFDLGIVFEYTRLILTVRARVCTSGTRKPSRIYEHNTHQFVYVVPYAAFLTTCQQRL